MSVCRNATFVTNKTVPTTMAVIVDPATRARVEASAKLRNWTKSATLLRLIKIGLKTEGVKNAEPKTRR